MNKIKEFISTHPTFVEHVKSAVITFLSGFILVLALEIDSLDLQSLEVSTIIGLVMAGVRGGVKALIQAFTVWYASKK